MLGLIADRHLTYSAQLDALALRGRQRLGFLRRACNYLGDAHSLVCYKAFVRPRLEYAFLAWMGAAPTHLDRLDSVQRSAAALIGPAAARLDFLEHRRRVGALTYLYKLQCWEVPPMLRQMIPERLARPTWGRTRASQAAHDGWHEHMLTPLLPGPGPDILRRSFPACVVADWNRLPADFFSGGIERSKLQTFKVNVHRFLRPAPQ